MVVGLETTYGWNCLKLSLPLLAESLFENEANPGKKNPRDTYKVIISFAFHNPAVSKNTH